MQKRLSLTPRQNEIYEFIRSHIRQRSVPPTIAEIGQQFGMRSTNGVNDVLNVLEHKGYLARLRGAARGITLTEQSVEASANLPGAKRIPIVGDGNAENPFSILMNPHGMLTIDTAMYPMDDLFASVVQDDAMDGDGLYKSDFVIVKQVAVRPENGTMIFGLSKSDKIIRRISTSNQTVVLTASNKYYPPIALRDGDKSVAVVGIVVGVMRKM